VKYIILFLVSLPLFLSAQTADDIVGGHYQGMLRDLKAYMAANPQAADLSFATSKAIEAAFYAGDRTAMMDLLGEQFERLADENPIQPQEFAQTAMMLAQFSMEDGDTETLRAVQATVREVSDSSQDPILAQVKMMLDSISDSPELGSRPEFSGVDVTGNAVNIEDFRGKVVLLDFWATWCGPCLAELPKLKEAYERFHDKGFEIIAISLDQDKDTLTSFIEKENLEWVNLFDAEQASSLADQFQVTSIPSLFLLDAEGKLVAVNPRGDALGRELEKLLGE